MQVQAHKVAAIRATGAETVVTSCPACRMQLEDGLAQAGLRPQVLHITQVLDQAYAAASQGAATRRAAS